MSREWKAGDVAMVRFVNGASEHRAMRDADGRGWGVVSHAGSLQVADARPLVVIDPEDREQVERLRDLLPIDWNLTQPDDPMLADESADQIAAALREFADPKPRIEEPTNWLAAVIDRDGYRWSRTSDRVHPWMREDGTESAKWDGIDVAEILSDGVVNAHE